MHLLKDENGLGIHIAGGRGSKKGDIGIFVAGITEGGAAFRCVEPSIYMYHWQVIIVLNIPCSRKKSTLHV